MKNVMLIILFPDAKDRCGSLADGLMVIPVVERSGAAREIIKEYPQLEQDDDIQAARDFAGD